MRRWLVSAKAMLTVRIGEAEDCDVCASLVATYSTRMSWQLTPDGDASRSGPLQLALQQVRLPRLLTLTLPTALVSLHDVWSTYDLALVAQDEDDICGFLCLRALPDLNQALIARLLVDVSSRGKGAGSALVRAAIGWAASQNLLRLLAHVPLRNTPGSSFYQHRGFRICGVSEHFYPTREDALLLERWV